MRFSILNIPKSLSKQAGIYCIININNDKRYTGQSGNIYRRLDDHLKDLLKNKHYNEYLQRSFNKHGSDSFVVEILQHCQNNEHELLAAEQYWIDFYESYNKNKGYNWGPCAANAFKGAKHTNETKQKISILMTGKKRSQEFKDNLSKKLTGRKREKWEIDKIKQGIIDKKAHDKEKKKAILVSPEGEIIEVIGIREFCRKYNLHRWPILQLLKGEILFASGWRVYDGTNAHPMAKFKKGQCANPEKRSENIRTSKLGKSPNKKQWKIAYFLSPDNVVYETDNLSALSRIIHITQTTLSRLLYGKIKQYRGWKFLKSE